MSFLAKLVGGLKQLTGPDTDERRSETDTVRRIVAELDRMEPDQARYLGAFAFIMGRVAHADLDISQAETAEMERICQRLGHLPEHQAVLVVQIAKTQARLFGGTENYLVTREFKQLATPEQREELLHCLFAVSAADDSISATEENVIRQVSDELGFTHADFVRLRSDYSSKRAVLKSDPGE